MGDILAEEQGKPATPSAGQGVIFIDTSGILCHLDDGGIVRGRSSRGAVAAQGPGFAADTYVTNSGIIIPSFSMQAGMVFKWQISASKTAAGTATPIYQVRIGSLQTTGDTSRLTLTGPAQTAAVDIGLLDIIVTVRNVSGAGIIQGTASWSHNGAAAGFANNDSGAVEGTSAAFDNTALGGQFVGLSINGGASAAWTLTQAIAEISF